MAALACLLAYLLALVMAGVVAAGWSSAARASHHPWYQDLEGHWAEDEVRVLWEEGVTDGYPLEDGRGDPVLYFLPDHSIERAQYGVMLAKVMGLEPRGGPPLFTDVPPDYRAGGDLEAFPWIQAGAVAGILTADSAGRFRPADATRRDEAVAMLIHALNLDHYARALSPERIAALLAPFRDAAHIRQELREEMAAAIDLAIVVGYGDGHLRPERLLTRGEAATLLYKSALIRVDADPPSFSPDGDQVDDSTLIRAEALLNQNQAGWAVDVLDAQGQPVRQWTGERLPHQWRWDGRDHRGIAVPAGTYLLRGRLATRQGLWFYSAIKPVEVIYHRLQAWVSPLLAYPGDPLTIQAVTEGPATAVRLLDPQGESQGLTGLGNGRWEGAWRVPSDCAPGVYSLQVEAEFPTTHRRTWLTVQVLPLLWLTAQVYPNPARPGDTVQVEASTSPHVEQVILRPPGQPPVTMERQEPGRWHTPWTVPPDAAPGVIPLVVEAIAPDGRTVTAELGLTVQVPARPRVVFHLSR